MTESTLILLSVAIGIVVAEATYLWSNDPERRKRARELLKLLLGR